MAHTFNSSSARKSFGLFAEPMDAGEYIYNKKSKTTFCIGNNKCISSMKVGSESNLLLLNRSNRLTNYPCKNIINKANLNINLISKIDLQGVPIIKDVLTHDSPSVISFDSIPFLDYQIDPSGNLFGNTTCGINNYVNYIVYETPNNNTHVLDNSGL
jgi:hypothetical protein